MAVKLKKSRKIVRFVTNMRKIVAFIPNLFTLGNLFCGCLGIIYAFSWRLDLAFYMVLLAAFLDFFDGFFARLLKVSGEMGKQLDSLADVVSFGVVPGIMMYQFLKGIALFENHSWMEGEMYLYALDPAALVALIIPVFSCYRLAKFNLDTRQSHGFIGLPTPANAIFFCAIVGIGSSMAYQTFMDTFIHRSFWDVGEYVSTAMKMETGVPEGNHSSLFFGPLLGPESQMALFGLFTNRILMIVLMIVFSLLLVSEIPLFALKFKNFGWADNRIRYIFLLAALALLILFHLVAIPFIVILYILLSIIQNIITKTHN